MTQLLINGRFLTRPATGVDRVATELTRALLQVGLPPPFSDLRILVPGHAGHIPSDLKAFVHHMPVPLGPNAWEQTTLARYKPDSWLVNLCNIGPVLRHRQVIMIHDAQVWDAPGSYTGAFRAWYRFALPRLGHRAGAVLTVSNHARRALESAGVVPPDRAQVILNGADHCLRVPADTGSLAAYGLQPHQYFLTLATEAPHKNLNLFEAVARDRPNQSAPIVCVGAQPNLARYKPNNSGKLRRLPRITDATLRSLFENALALLIPSWTEGFGLPAMEAMTLGCPVVASDRGALPEVCGKAATLIAPDDVQGWHTALHLLETTSLARDALRRAGLERAKSFTWARAGHRLAQVLASLPQSTVSAQTPSAPDALTDPPFHADWQRR